MEKTIQDSPFCNTYGGLSLVLRPSGEKFLKMDDCFGSDYFGPLTDDQVAAFKTLCDLPEAT